MTAILETLRRVVFMSDLHMEMRGYDPSVFSNVDADLVILAGDIGVGIEGVRWAQKAFKCPVLYVAGNHEFYRHDFAYLIEDMRDVAAGSNVTILENDAVVIDGIRFIGSTLWTNFKYFGGELFRPSIMEADRCMNDFHLIRGSLGPLTPPETIDRHEVSRRFLEKEIEASKEPVVVITHHTPSKVTTATKYELSLLTAAFTSNLDALIREPVVAWICGHTHHSGAWRVNGVPVLSNQWGYPSEFSAPFNPTWTIAAAIESCILNVG